ncbi:MAG: TetR/AcrR family transcriptional regulator [Dehalococcoidia bacterium]|nr:MAG: TetR/AcrR family transcriptional regulator [Dehalococcoidia bacterium]
MRKKRQPSIKYVRLLEVSRGLFFKYGVKRVTIEEICEKSNISKMTFYKYFSNKMQLAELVRDELLNKGFAKYYEINNLDISFPEKIDLITQWRIDFFSSMTAEFIEDMLDAKGTAEKMKEHYLKVISDAQKKGEVRKELSPELIWLVAEKLNEIVKDGSWKQVFTDYREFQRQMRRMYFYGLLESP